MIIEIQSFDASGLNKVETAEKVVLPSAEDIEQEKRLSTSNGTSDAAEVPVAE